MRNRNMIERIKDNFTTFISAHERSAGLSNNALSSLFSLHPTVVERGYTVHPHRGSWALRDLDGHIITEKPSAVEIAEWLAQQPSGGAHQF